MKSKKHEKENKLYGIYNEIHGLKTMITELQTILQTLDYEMRRDMKLMQTKVIGLETYHNVNALHLVYKKVKPTYRKKIQKV